MVDLLNKRCAKTGCKRQPSWARSQGDRAVFCKEHKEDGMVDTRHKTCLHPGNANTITTTTTTPTPNTTPTPITTTPTTTTPTTATTTTTPPTATTTIDTTPADPGPARYCAAHAPKGSINVAASRCRHPRCSVQPTFGRAGGGEPAAYCARHCKKGMVDVKNPRCIARGCMSQPSCGMKGDPRPTFCLRHAAPSMVNVRCGG
ncbi:unnamed protein product, partial [Laminaria digitata]